MGNSKERKAKVNVGALRALHGGTLKAAEFVLQMKDLQTRLESARSSAEEVKERVEGIERTMVRLREDMGLVGRLVIPKDGVVWKERMPPIPKSSTMVSPEVPGWVSPWDIEAGRRLPR